MAARKAAGLLEAGALIRVISPELHPKLVQMVTEGNALAELRAYAPGLLASLGVEKLDLVIAATDDPKVNTAVWEEARTLGCLVNVVDDPEHSNFILPAVVRRGELQIAISTGGASPALARRIREDLESQFGPEYGELAALLGELRPEILIRFPPGEARRKAALALIDSRLLDLLQAGEAGEARVYAFKELERIADQLSQ